MIWHPVTTTLHVYLCWKTDKLLWLPIGKRIKHKVDCMCFSATNGSGPAYLSELLHVYTPSRTLRSFSDTRMLKIQQHKCKTHGFRTFSLALDPTSGKHDGNLSHGKFSYSFLLARFQNPPFLRSLAVILNFPATTLVQVTLITVLKR